MRAGLILMMDRTFDERQNEIIVEKAIRYALRGIVGIDIAGPRPAPAATRTATLPRSSSRRARGPRRDGARGRGGVPRGDRRGGRDAAARPDRPRNPGGARPRAHRAAGRARHGARDLPDLDLLTGALADADAVRQMFRTFLDAGVRVTVSTDGPEMMRTHLRDEFAFLCRSAR